MNANETVAWLNERDPFHEWALNDDVFCLHCDGVFKVQDVACDAGDPTCPACHDSSPVDFANLPWWREDLVAERADGSGFVRKWRGKPIHAIAGKPGNLPRRKNYEAK